MACCISVPVYSQTTLQEVAQNPAVHVALLKKIERDKREIGIYQIGHVVVGRVLLDDSEDTELISSQMMILDHGYFSDAVRDLHRPIAFRMRGYRSMGAIIPPGAVPDDSGTIDIGTIQMVKCLPSEFGKAVGMISVPGEQKGEGARRWQEPLLLFVGHLRLLDWSSQ